MYADAKWQRQWSDMERMARPTYSSAKKGSHVFGPERDPDGVDLQGHTHIRLAAANEDILTCALRTAWKLRIETNAKTREKRRASAADGGTSNKKLGKR